MSVDTRGKIKGFVSHEDILKYLKNNYDKNAHSEVKRTIYGEIKNTFSNKSYMINSNSDNDKDWYIEAGFIYFRDEEEDRVLFYNYSNVNFFENLEYYQELNLEDMVRTETTDISLDLWGNSVEIIEDIVQNFGGGWLDEDDCDDEPYYVIEPLIFKIGGIYAHKNNFLKSKSHFIVLSIDKKYFCVNIDLTDGCTNKIMQMVINYDISHNLIVPQDVWSTKSQDDIINTCDGYLGTISRPLLRKLKEKLQEII